MNMPLKVGARLKSTVCEGEVMVISSPDEDIELTCGGAVMTGAANECEKGELDPDHAGGVQIGKRYVGLDGKLEVLCVKPGEGSLATKGTVLTMKDAKKLPKTD